MQKSNLHKNTANIYKCYMCKAEKSIFYIDRITVKKEFPDKILTKRYDLCEDCFAIIEEVIKNEKI